MPSTRFLLVTLLVAVVLSGAGAGAVAADGRPTGTPEDARAAAPTATVTTGGAQPQNATTLSLWGRVTNVSETTNATVGFEYRVVSSAGRGNWTRTRGWTRPGSGYFDLNVTGLQPGATYEYRAVVAVGEELSNGSVQRVTMPGRTETRTPTPTPPPCPNFRGAGALCTSTPTPTTPTDADLGAQPPADDPRTRPRARDSSLVAWFGGLLPLLAWVGAIAVLAPLVLGGLIGLDSLRGRD
jgi:hypothetical protein